MTSSLPQTFEHFPARSDQDVKRAVQRVVHAEEIALGFAAVGVWTYAVLSLFTG